MKSFFYTIIFALLIPILFFTLIKHSVENDDKSIYGSWWEFQCIDTMKYSRDLAREKLNDLSFDKIIDQQVSEIAATGATHVGIATPYDDEFIPFLTRWVDYARKYNLKIWFRGNWSGWEKWFEYDVIRKDEHISKTKAFILNHQELFQDGDIFSACPECENGALGDPRKTGNLYEYRQFLIDEYKVTKTAFTVIGKDIKSNYNSMNADVALLVMDPKTTQNLDGLVVIDHYVAKPEKLKEDIVRIANFSKGKVVLGEFGVPIIDINGEMNEEDQANWIDQALGQLINLKELNGVNYWANTGSSTQIWNENGQARKLKNVIGKYFKPVLFQAVIINEIGEHLPEVTIEINQKATISDKQGQFSLVYYPFIKNNLTTKSNQYLDNEFNLDSLSNEIILVKKDEDTIFKIRKFFYNINKIFD